MKKNILFSLLAIISVAAPIARAEKNMNSKDAQWHTPTPAKAWGSSAAVMGAGALGLVGHQLSTKKRRDELKEVFKRIKSGMLLHKGNATQRKVMLKLLAALVLGAGAATTAAISVGELSKGGNDYLEFQNPLKTKEGKSAWNPLNWQAPAQAKTYQDILDSIAVQKAKEAAAQKFKDERNLQINGTLNDWINEQKKKLGRNLTSLEITEKREALEKQIDSATSIKRIFRGFRGRKIAAAAEKKAKRQAQIALLKAQNETKPSHRAEAEDALPSRRTAAESRRSVELGDKTTVTYEFPPRAVAAV